MTILKEGTPKTYIYECGECGCIFTGDSSEIGCPLAREGCLKCDLHSIAEWLEKED